MAKDNSLTYRGAQGTQFYGQRRGGERRLKDIKEDKNPFKKKSLDKFDLAAYGAGAQKGKETFNVNDARRLMKEGGYSAEELSDYAGSLGEGQVAKKAQQFLDRKMSKLATDKTKPESGPGSSVGNITKNNMAINTGDISIGGDNMGTANTGVIDSSTNLAAMGAAGANKGQRGIRS